MRGHRQVEHTADLALEIWAPTEEEILLEGASALCGIMMEGEQIPALEERALSLEVLDREDRLVQWLNEIIYLAVTDGYIFREGEITLGEDTLSAKVMGAVKRIKSELKSVTYHGLSLSETDGGFRATIIVDV